MISQQNLVENGLKDGYLNVPMNLGGRRNYLLILKECAPMVEAVVQEVEQWKGLGRNINGWHSMSFWQDSLITIIGLIEGIAMYPMMICMKDHGKSTNGILIQQSGRGKVVNIKPFTINSVLGGSPILFRFQ